MKLSVSVFDISLPSQHLVFVFDAPKWLLMRPASVPALWNEEMCCSAASRRCCYSAIRNSESSSFGCYSFCPLPARPGVSLQLLQVRHTSLCVLIWEEIFIHLSSCPSAVDAQLSLMQTERRGAGHFLPHLRAGKVWKSEGSCAFGAISLFFFFLGAREARSWVVQSGLKTDVLITAVQFWFWSIQNYNFTITTVTSDCFFCICNQQ